MYLLIYALITLSISYYDFRYKEVPVMLLLSLFPLAFFVNPKISIIVILIINFPITIIFISNKYNMQLGDYLAYIIISFYITQTEIMLFFVLNLCCLILTYICVQEKIIPMIPSILIPVFFIKCLTIS